MRKSKPLSMESAAPIASSNTWNKIRIKNILRLKNCNRKQLTMRWGIFQNEFSTKTARTSSTRLNLSMLNCAVGNDRQISSPTIAQKYYLNTVKTDICQPLLHSLSHHSS